MALSIEPGSAKAQATDYASGVVDGAIVAGRLVRLACQRFLNDLRTGEARGLRFSDVQADRVLFYFGHCVRHWKGKWAGELVRLEPWQIFIEANLFGWQRRNEEGKWVRRFRKSYEQVGRKNGKTFRLAGRGIYMLRFDGEHGAEVYSAATKLDQAKITWDCGRQIVLRDPELVEALDIYGGKSPRSTGSISFSRSASKFEPLGADYDTMDGTNPHAALVDELHAHKTSGVVDVLESGMGARDQALLCMITTAGFSKDSPCWEERAYAEQVLEGFEDDSYFAYVAELDEGDDWTDPALWAKGNPNLGVSVSMNYLKDRLRRALKDPAKQNDFKRKNLDLWTEQETRWISVEAWDACKDRRPDEELPAMPCFGGIDLASVKDTTALAWVFPPDSHSGLWSVRARVFLPAEGIADKERVDRAPYRLWAEQGWLELTDGNITDYDVLRARILEDGQRYQVQEIGFDPWNATQLATQLTGDGFTMVKMRQGMLTLSEPMKRLEKLVLSGRIDHGGNPVLRWALSNVAVRTDANENMAPTKQKSSGRIDPIVATILAIGRAIVKEDNESAYNQGAKLAVRVR